MIYLDYSATTFPNSKVLKTFNKACKKYHGNPNSSHYLGVKAKKEISDATLNIANILGIKDYEIIYTSGASEANNLAIKGLCKANKGKHIITTKMEHSSVVAPINRLCSDGYEVSFVNLKSSGLIDVDHLKSIIRDDTVLVSIVGVDSELGIKQNIKAILEVLKEYPNCYFHVDATQMVGKTTLELDGVDLVSFSAHKFFGIKGIGCLLKKKNVKLIPLIDGGASTTKYRSGTPTLELILSLEKALSLAYKDFYVKEKYINKLNNDLKKFLASYSNIKINSTKNSVSQIINFSCDNADKFVQLLNKNKVYLSTKSACSSADSLSKSVSAIYNDEYRAKNSVRISLSYVTSKREIKKFMKIFDECYKRVNKDENIKV